MKIKHLVDFDSRSESCVAIGIFDGVHIGHQRVLGEARAASEARNLTPLGLTFNPHPLAVLAPEKAPSYLCSLTQKAEWMTRPGLVDYVVVAHFDESFARLSPRMFVEQILVKKLRARNVRVGADFRFGHDRTGSVMDLESLGEQYGFTVTIVHAVARGGERVSSSKIRTLVSQGAVRDAAKLLSRPFTLRGTVVRGKQLGASIGFPTANIKPEMTGQLLPANGVYSGYALLGPGEPRLRAAVSVGTNPTTDVGDQTRKTEAYIIDGLDGDLYDRTIDLEFMDRVRDQQKFDNVADLVAQIECDVADISSSLSKIA